MKKFLIVAIVCCLPLFTYGQTREKECYVYNVVKLSGNLGKGHFKVRLDDGRAIKRFKDADGKKIKFRTPAAVLTYLAAEGWELYKDGADILGDRYKGKKTHKAESSWIIRKTCTPEELEQFLDKGIKGRKAQ